MSNFRYCSMLLIPAICASMFAGCGNADNPPSGGKAAAPDENKPKEPVTISLFTYLNGISEDRLQQFIVEPLKQKLPHVTLKIIRDGKGSSIDDLVAAGDFPDLFYGSNPQFPAFLSKELQYDMTELVKKHNVDLSRFNPAFIDAVKQFGDKGQLYGIPFSTNLGVVIFNKEIFDRFGVQYPKDGMTWDEFIELGRKLTRTQDGVSYIGFDPGNATEIGQGLSLPYVDTKTMKALVDNDQWRKIFDLLKKAYSVQGFVNNGKFDYGNNAFIKDKNNAMRPIWALQILNAKTDLANTNWDIVSLPNFQENLGQGREVDIHMISISKSSKHKDEAMEVLKVITSDEVQKLMNEYGTPTVLKNPEIQKVYGSKLPEFKDKNVQALFKTTPRVPHVINTYEGTVRTIINNARKDIALGTKDVNTALREAQQLADQKLAEIK